jgi:hypothetical protein
MNNKISIIIVIIFIIAIIIYCSSKLSSGSGGSGSGSNDNEVKDRSDDGEFFIYSPKWVTAAEAGVSEEFNPYNPITLVFSYNYSALNSYTPSDLSFSLVLVKCNEEEEGVYVCPPPQCGGNNDNPYCSPINTKGGSIVGVSNFTGTNTDYWNEVTTSDSKYTVAVDPPEGGRGFEEGVYTGYVMSYLTRNDKVQSDPAQTEGNLIAISGDFKNPPEYNLSVDENTKYTGDGSNNKIYYYPSSTTSILFNYEKEVNYIGPNYTLSLQIIDITLDQNNNTPLATFSVASNSISYTLSDINIYPGEFKAILISTTIDLDPNTSINSNIITYVVKLQAPSDVSVTQ